MFAGTSHASTDTIFFYCDCQMPANSIQTQFECHTTLKFTMREVGRVEGKIKQYISPSRVVTQERRDSD